MPHLPYRFSHVSHQCVGGKAHNPAHREFPAIATLLNGNLAIFKMSAQPEAKRKMEEACAALNSKSPYDDIRVIPGLASALSGAQAGFADPAFQIVDLPKAGKTLVVADTASCFCGPRSSFKWVDVSTVAAELAKADAECIPEINYPDAGTKKSYRLPIHFKTVPKIDQVVRVEKRCVRVVRHTPPPLALQGSLNLGGLLTKGALFDGKKAIRSQLIVGYATKYGKGATTATTFEQYLAPMKLGGCEPVAPWADDSDAYFVEQRMLGVNPCKLRRISSLTGERNEVRQRGGGGGADVWLTGECGAAAAWLAHGETTPSPPPASPHRPRCGRSSRGPASPCPRATTSTSPTMR